MKSSALLRKIPFLRLLVFFTGGILSGFLNPKPVVSLLPLLVTIMLLVALVLIIRRLPASMNSAFLTTILLLFIMFLSGTLSAYPAKIFQHDISSFPNPGTFIAVVSDLPEEKPASIKAEIKVLAVRDSVIRTVKKFRALVYFQKSKAASELLPGTMICINSPLDDISPPQNPGEFNYKKYLANHGIYRQAYVPVNSWCTLPQKSHTLMTVSMLCRKQLTDKFRDLPLSPDESAVLSAITLGYRSNIDSGIKESFTAAGVMHVMALSGFNVGVIALFLGGMLWFTKGSIQRNRIRTIIIIPSLWCFAFITGLTPSVVRATVMLSLVLAGKTMGKNIISQNIIMSSAFLILAVKPGMLGDTGFQLSFCAVYGIIVYHPVLVGMVKIKSGLLLRLWQFFMLSFAAQISTLPVSLYSFHQFPVYFWLTNLYVIPLVSAIIYLSSFYLIFSFINPLGVFSGKILVCLVRWLLQGVSIVKKAPFSLIDNIFIDKVQLLMLFVLIASLILLIRYRKRLFVNLSMLCCSIILLIGLSAIIAAQKQHLLVVNNIRNATAMTFINGRNSLLLAGPASFINPSVMSYSFDNFHIQKRIRKVDVLDLSNTDKINLPDLKCIDLGQGNKVFLFHGKTILRLANPKSILTAKNTPKDTSKDVEAPASTTPMFDIIIISSKDYHSLQTLKSNLNFKLLVIDSSVTQYYSGKWAESCMNFGVNFHTVRSGSYALEW